MNAFAAIAGKAFLDADNAHVEVFLVADLVILHEGNAQATTGDIHHQHALAFAADFFTLKCIANGHKFGVDFLWHIHHVYLKACFAIDLVQQKDLVAGLAHGSGSLQLVFFYAIFNHQSFKALQNLADF